MYPEHLKKLQELYGMGEDELFRRMTKWYDNIRWSTDSVAVFNSWSIHCLMQTGKFGHASTGRCRALGDFCTVQE